MYYSYLLLSDNERCISINKEEALKIELNLNLSKKARLWSNIGDILYKFSIDDTCATIMPPSNTLYVTKIQFNYLLNFLCM